MPVRTKTKRLKFHGRGVLKERRLTFFADKPCVLHVLCGHFLGEENAL